MHGSSELRVRLTVARCSCKLGLDTSGTQIGRVAGRCREVEIDASSAR